MRIALIATITLALAPAAMAQQQTPPADATAATPAPPKEKKICRSEQKVGSIMLTRTCHTKAEWAQVDAANEASMEARRRGNEGAAGMAGGPL